MWNLTMPLISTCDKWPVAHALELCWELHFWTSLTCQTVCGRPKNSLVTVAHVPGPLPECWQSQSDRFAHFMTKWTTINHILFDILFEMKVWNLYSTVFQSTVSWCFLCTSTQLTYVLTKDNHTWKYGIVKWLNSWGRPSVVCFQESVNTIGPSHCSQRWF